MAEIVTDSGISVQRGRRGTAVFSSCQTYRYLLEYDLEPIAPIRSDITFLMMNPSTADADEPDPTVRRCMGFATRWGYSRLVVLNAFAVCETNSKALTKYKDPVGPRNDEFIACRASNSVIVAWGKPPLPMRERARRIVELLGPDRVVRCLAQNKDGSPKHPLYLRADAVPHRFFLKEAPNG